MAAAMPRNIGIFGGSFNPPHIAHVLGCQFALAVWPLDKIIIVPTFVHPFDKALETFDHRHRMCALAFKHLHHGVEISRIEEELGSVSYSIDTVHALRKYYPGAAFKLIVGSDILGETERWKDFAKLREETDLLVLPRTGSRAGSFDERVCLPDVSSTWIREALGRGEDVGAALPREVHDYIRQYGLYRKP